MPCKVSSTGRMSKFSRFMILIKAYSHVDVISTLKSTVKTITCTEFTKLQRIYKSPPKKALKAISVANWS